MELRRIGWQVPLFVVAMTSFLACGSGKGFDWTSLPKAWPAIYMSGTPVSVAQATIDATGGTLFGLAGTPLEGVVVTFPPGALTQATIFTLGYDDGGTFTNVRAEELSGVVIALDSSGESRFGQPVKIQFPFTDPIKIPVPYYIDEKGLLQVMRPLPLDRTTGLAGFVTWHASNYTWTNKDPAAPNQPVFNGFQPGLDGFAFSNVKGDPKYAPNGRCWGMCSFATWFRGNQGGGLYGQFTGPIPTVAPGDTTLTGQEIIATRAHNSVTYYADENALMVESDVAATIVAIQDALLKGAPAVMLGLVSPSGAHAVLAIGFSDNQIALYDPNWPGVFKAIDYSFNDPVTHAPSISYGDYTELGVWGNGDMKVKEGYQTMLVDAQTGFQGDNETTVEITSHQPGETVATRDITLEGKIHSGRVSITDVELRVAYEDGTEEKQRTFSLDPGQEDFGEPVTLKPGANRIRFVTKGYPSFGSGQAPIDIPNNLDVKEFSLQCTQPITGSISANVTLVSVGGDPSDPDTRDEVTVNFSTNIVARFVRGSVERIVAGTFSIDSCMMTTDCVIVDARSTTSLPDITTNPNPPRQPVLATYTRRHYSRTDHGFELTQTADANGSSSEQLLLLKISVEPQCTEDNRQYRVTLSGGYPNFNPQNPLLVTNRHLDTTTRAWVDDDPSPLPDLEFAVLDARDNSNLSSISPPRIAPSGFEDFIINGAQPQTWSVVGTVRSDDAASSEADDATLSLTLVP